MNMCLCDIYFKTCAYISIFFIHAVFYQINYFKFFLVNSPPIKEAIYYVQNYVQLIVGMQYCVRMVIHSMIHAY